MYHNFKELFAASQQAGGIARAVLENEVSQFDRSEDAVYEELAARWRVMEHSAKRALAAPQRMPGDLVTGQAAKQGRYAIGGGYMGGAVNLAMAMAFSSSEMNAAMGRICAAPTAGACGVLPAVLIAAGEKHGAAPRQMQDALLVAGGVGAIITRNATVSGAEGGCQAECGAAAAMAAAAAVLLAGGTDHQIGQAVSISLMNCMGLVCDPVAGLVQLPCSFRNASQAVNALASADMALAGQEAVIPPDEVVEAMGKVGRSLPPALRETSKGGVAASPTARALQETLKLGEI